MAQRSIQCPSCGTRYAGRHQLATGLNGKSCSNCGEQIFAHLYHQTSSSTANSIMSTQHMKPGKKGMAGPGIYFATNPYPTNRKLTKEQQKGPILQADVYLGKLKNVGYGGNKSLNGKQLAQQRYNSVHIPRNGDWYGAEKVVYNSNQISNIRRWSTDNPIDSNANSSEEESQHSPPAKNQTNEDNTDVLHLSYSSNNNNSQKIYNNAMYDKNYTHNKSSSSSYLHDTNSQSTDVSASVSVDVSHYLKHNILSSRSDSSLNENQSSSTRYKVVSNLNISSKYMYDNNKTQNKSSSSSHDINSQSTDVGHKSSNSKSRSQSNDKLAHNILSSRSDSLLNENQSTPKRYKAASDSGSETVSNLNILSNEYDKNKSATSSSQLENNKITQTEVQQLRDDTIRNSLISTEKLLTLANQFKSNEAFQKELSNNSNLIVEYPTGNKTTDSSSTQSNDSSSTGESKRNSDENSDNSNDDSSHDEKDNNNDDEHDEKDNNNDSNDHKCTMHKYHCNVSWHAVRLKQLEEENKKLKLLLKQQTTVDNTNDSQSYDTIVDVQENKHTTNFKVTRKLTKTIIPNKSDELFCNAFDYMNKYFHIHNDVIQDYKSDEKEVKVIDCGIQGKTTKETLYVVCEKQNKSNDNVTSWKTNDELYSVSMLEQMYKISKEHLLPHVTITNKTITAIKNAKEHITHILQNKTHRNVMIGSKHTPWNNEDKIPVFNKASRQSGLTLILEKHQFVEKLKTFADKNVNDIQLIPIVRFNNENKYFYEIAWIVEIGKDINIAISFKHIKNKYLPSAIYLDVHDAHKLVVYKHNCDCLTNFNCFIDRLQIGENKQTRMHQRYKSEMQQKINEQGNQINKQQNQIDGHDNQMQNYLRLREQDMLIIDDMKLTYANLQSELQSLLKLQCNVNEQQQICNRLHEVNTLNTLHLNPESITVYSNQLTTQFNNLNSNQQQ